MSVTSFACSQFKIVKLNYGKDFEELIHILLSIVHIDNSRNPYVQRTLKFV